MELSSDLCVCTMGHVPPLNTNKIKISHNGSVKMKNNGDTAYLPSRLTLILSANRGHDGVDLVRLQMAGVAER